jgi:hypothetical protein
LRKTLWIEIGIGKSSFSPTGVILAKQGVLRDDAGKGMHWITQHPNSGDGDLDGVVGDQRTNARRCACGDEVAGKEGHHVGNPANQEGDGKSHERSIGGLAELAVDATFHEGVRGVELRFNVRANGAESVKALGAGKLHVGFLEVARGYVVEAGVAENVGKRVGIVGQLRTFFADDDGEFAFVFDTLGSGGEKNGLVGTDEGRRRLEKDEWFLGHFVAEFDGVSGVVTADTDDFAGIARSEELHIMEVPNGMAFDPAGPGQTGEFADTIGVENAVGGRVYAARRSGEWQEAAKFHAIEALA